MGPKDTYESYVMRAGDIAENLSCNPRWVTHTALVQAIVAGLPASFDSGKSSLRSNGRRMTLEEFCDEIKREAKYLDIPKPRMPERRALNANFNPGNAKNHGRGGARGKSQGMRFNDNCGKHGHTAKDCSAEWSNYAFKPPRRENGAGPFGEPRALITNLDVGSKGT
jgi:hypothetical protein